MTAFHLGLRVVFECGAASPSADARLAALPWWAPRASGCKDAAAPRLDSLVDGLLHRAARCRRAPRFQLRGGIFHPPKKRRGHLQSQGKPVSCCHLAASCRSFLLLEVNLGRRRT